MDDLKAKYLDQIANASDEAVLEDIRLAAVGKKGEVALKMRELGKMTPEERQTAGPALERAQGRDQQRFGGQEIGPRAMPRLMPACARNGWMLRCPRARSAPEQFTRFLK